MSEVPPLGSLLDLGCRLMMHRSHLLYCAAGGRADDIPRSPEGTTWRALPPIYPAECAGIQEDRYRGFDHGPEITSATLNRLMQAVRVLDVFCILSCYSSWSPHAMEDNGRCRRRMHGAPSRRCFARYHLSSTHRSLFTRQARAGSGLLAAYAYTLKS